MLSSEWSTQNVFDGWVVMKCMFPTTEIDVFLRKDMARMGILRGKKNIDPPKKRKK